VVLVAVALSPRLSKWNSERGFGIISACLKPHLSLIDGRIFVSIVQLLHAANALQRPEASVSTASRAEVEEKGRDRGDPGANGDGEGWKRRAAGEGVPSLRGK
jgi:hypothetical protein